MWLLYVIFMLCAIVIIEVQSVEIKRLNDDKKHLEWCIEQDKYHNALRKWIDVMSKKEVRNKYE